MFEKINVELMNGCGARIVDLRTDTISKPTQEMREAMYNAVVGDDVYREDPTVAELEERAAALLGKEEALFVASGTMANLIARGPSQIAGVQSAVIKNNEDGTFNLDELRKKIRRNPDCHEPITSLIIVENTHNFSGGKVLPLEWLEKVGNIAGEHNIPVHMDGARVMNAAVYLKVPPKRVVRDVDTVCFCLSKGLGAPVGSLLAGSSSFVAKAKRTRKVLGGGWRQAGILAAAGLVALDKMIDRLQEDHDHAYRIAKAIADLNSPTFKIDINTVQTNIFLLKMDSIKVDAKDVQQRLATIKETDPIQVIVKVRSRDSDFIRVTTYWEITDEDVKHAIDKIVLVLKEFDEELLSCESIDLGKI